MNGETNMKFIWMLVLMFFVPPVYAESTQCDKGKFDVEYSNRTPMGWERVKLIVTNGKEEVTKQFKYVHFFISCVKNSANKSYIVYQAYCGGSGCKDLGNWGIVEPTPLRVLLDPSDDNHEKAEHIFGGKLEPFFAGKSHSHKAP
jgi:hypothetical protein